MLIIHVSWQHTGKLELSAPLGLSRSGTYSSWNADTEHMLNLNPAELGVTDRRSTRHLTSFDPLYTIVSYIWLICFFRSIDSNNWPRTSLYFLSKLALVIQHIGVSGHCSDLICKPVSPETDEP